MFAAWFFPPASCSLGIRRLRKAMCILSLPMQLLKPQSRLKNISPNYTVFHHFFLTPWDSLLAYRLPLFSIAPLGVWELNDITHEYIIRNKYASFQICNARRNLENLSMKEVFSDQMETLLSFRTLPGKSWKWVADNLPNCWSQCHVITLQTWG